MVARESPPRRAACPDELAITASGARSRAGRQRDAASVSDNHFGSTGGQVTASSRVKRPLDSRREGREVSWHTESCGEIARERSDEVALADREHERGTRIVERFSRELVNDDLARRKVGRLSLSAQAMSPFTGDLDGAERRRDLLSARPLVFEGQPRARRDRASPAGGSVLRSWRLQRRAYRWNGRSSRASDNACRPR